MTVKKKQLTRGVILRPDDVALEGISGELKVSQTGQKLQAYLDSAQREVLTADQVQSLSNKTIDVDNNTLSNVEVDNLKAGVLNTSGTLTGASDLQVPSALAVKTYADAVATTAQTNLDNHINDLSDAHDASAISNVPAGTIAATDVQTAINELDGDIQGHITDAVDAHDASAISVVPTGNLASTEVQAALVELQTDIDTNATNLSNHLSDAVDAHDASAISNIPAGTIAATDVQAAINELDGDIQAHITDTTDAHDASAISVVPTGNLTSTDVQAALVEIQTQVDTLTGDVTGPVSSTDNAVARFDGTTGKIIQNSAVTISDTGAITNSAEVIFGTGTTESVISRLRWQGITAEQGDSASNTGSNVTLPTAAQPIRILTGVGLVSIDMIPSAATYQVLTLVNQTGADVTINNDTGATAADRIITGTGSSLTLKNDSAITLRYIPGTNSRWYVIGGTGGTGSQSLDQAFQLTGLEQVSTWASGNNAAFLGGGSLAGTFVLSTSSPLNGTNSYVYTQAAGSLNDYIASPIQSVPLKFRGNQATFYFDYTYNGGSSDIEAVVYDVTNAALISIPAQSLVPVSSTTGSLYKMNVLIPSTCTQVRVGFQVKVLNSGRILKFDDVVLSDDVTRYSSSDEVSSARYVGSSSRGAVATRIVRFDTLASSFGNGLTVTSDANSGTIIRVNTAGVINISASFVAAAGAVYTITKNQANLTVIPTQAESMSTGYVATSGGNCTVSWEGQAIPGDLFRISSATSPTADNFNNLNATLTASNPQIITASESFSTDTAQLVYAPSSTFTLATLSNAPVGTFITFTYASGGNVRTQTTTAPTQSTSDMNTNGIQLFTRAGNASSTAANPAAIAIQIGKGLKGKNLELFKSAGKVTSGSLDYSTVSSAEEFGASYKDYNENTGILYIDAAQFRTSAVSSARYFNFSDLTTQTNGYVVINASKSPALVGVPQVLPRIATLSDVKAAGTQGGTFTAGAFVTRTLNTLSDPQNIGVTLASNQFTLQPGSYYIEAETPAFAVNRHVARLRNITDSVDSLIGIGAYSSSTGNQNNSVIKGTITITSPKVFEIQERCETTGVTNGLGVAMNFGVNEVYTVVKIQKVQ
jgi:hypothetical protein